MAVVYRHIREDTNEVFYIGIGKTDKRAYNKFHHRSIFWKNIAKNGFKVDIIFDDLTWSEACEKEKEFILIYGRRDLGLGSLVNMTDGGDGGFGVIVKDETKEKIRQYQLSLNKKGKPGRTQSEEVRRKIKETLTGRKRPEDVIQKMRKPKLNKENYSKPKQKIECPHCQMMSQPSLAYRWHFDNCKNKIKI
jgi:hypothetical protein